MNNILRAREQRGTHIQTLIKTHPNETIVVLKLNTIGTDKNPKHTRFILNMFDRYISKEFKEVLTLSERNSSLDGDYIYYIVKMESKNVKQATVQLEDDKPFGRLVDIDVYNEVPLSRIDLSLPSRKCFICDNEAHICSRNKTHTLEEINSYIQTQIETELPIFIANHSLVEIYRELEMYPKFGLVTKIDTGCHTDMDYDMFIRSSFLFRPYIETISKLTIKDFCPKNFQSYGLAFENKMFEVTGGINTQKGLIFAIGIFIPCLIQTIIQNEDEVYLIELIKDTASNIIGDYYDTIGTKEELTHGDQIFLDTGIKGIRGEALNGFKLIFDTPDYNDTKEELKAYEYFLYIMANLDDTTIIHKTKLDTLREVQSTMKQFVKNGGYKDNLDTINNLSETYKSRNISPGGSSDLLVLKMIYEQLKYLLQ